MVARHPGVSMSSMAARLVDEGLRMDEHPGVFFRQGPTGRRATLVAGPDVWEVIRAVQSGRAEEPELGETELLDMVADNTGVPLRLIRVAIDYWAAHPTEIDALIADAQRFETEKYRAWERTNELLNR